jgi:hypothetical protein
MSQEDQNEHHWLHHEHHKASKATLHDKSLDGDDEIEAFQKKARALKHVGHHHHIKLE